MGRSITGTAVVHRGIYRCRDGTRGIAVRKLNSFMHPPTSGTSFLVRGSCFTHIVTVEKPEQVEFKLRFQSKLKISLVTILYSETK